LLPGEVNPALSLRIDCVGRCLAIGSTRPRTLKAAPQRQLGWRSELSVERKGLRGATMSDDNISTEQSMDETLKELERQLADEDKPEDQPPPLRRNRLRFSIWPRQPETAARADRRTGPRHHWAPSRARPALRRGTAMPTSVARRKRAGERRRPRRARLPQRSARRSARRELPQPARRGRSRT
jgi:hypothetical protein